MSTMPIRVLHVLTAMNRAGTETMLMNQYRNIDRSKIQFDFAVSTNNHCDYDDEIISLGGRIINYPKYIGTNHFQYKKWWKSFFNEHPEYRIVHGHIGSTAAIYLHIAKNNGCFTIAHSHSAGNGIGLKAILYKLFSYPTRYIADFYIGCSMLALKKRYGTKIAKNDKKSFVLKNGIDVDQYKYSEQRKRRIRAELGLKDTDFVVGTVGRFNEAKNPFFIVNIIEELKRKEPDFCFIWAGTGELKNDITKLIKQKNISENVRLLGVRDDVPELLQALNVFVLPSKYEGLPVIGVEVQAAGVPMLCSEKVSPELNISKCISFLSIDSFEPWVDEILKERTFRRIVDSATEVKRAGYDICVTVKWLEEFYASNLK